MTNHEEWLSLVEVSGPFLTLPVLERVFPQGLDTLDRDLAARLRSAREEWADAQVEGGQETEAIHLAWIDMVLREALGLNEEVLLAGKQIPDEMDAEIAEHHERLAPDYVIVNPEGSPYEGNPRLLIQVWPPDQDLDAPVEGKPWSASPAERMTTLCRSTDVRIGLVTNGEHWMLVDAPVGETSGYASWYASLWSAEPLTLRAFQCLLGASGFFNVAESDTLEAMLIESVAYQQEVTDQLGVQVRQAVEVLVQALDRSDQDRDRKLLKEVPPDRLYDAALTVMMRLVFLFCAEERGLILLGDPIYDTYYAVSTLRGQLREEADLIGIEVLERRQDAWARLLATFRGVYAGIQHETLRLPALGGSLFDPDRYSFLEGREEGTTWSDTTATPLPIDNRTVLHLLESLQLLRRQSGRGRSEARRLSFRALDIEQIGHVYEGLLDHVAVRVETPTLGLKGAQGLEPEIPLDELEEKRDQSKQDLLDLLKNQTKRSVSALENDLKRDPGDQAKELLRITCGNDQVLIERVLPFHALLRKDAWGYPVVYRAGGFMVTGGPERRETGTQYTPQSLTETIVAETLIPLVYEGPAEGNPRGEWELRSPEQLLDLKICDMAMGSGAFLVQVCRWLAERLVESWEEARAQGKLILSEGEVVDEAYGRDLLPADREERLFTARRLVSERCIYGVDINPLAVELAKLSIWLVTMAKARPFGFLDHNLRSGDSLLGVQDLDQIRHFHMDPERGRELHVSLFDPTEQIDTALEQALQCRRELRSVRILDIEDIRKMARLDQEARKVLEKAEVIADLLIGCAIASAGRSQKVLEDRLVSQMENIRQWLTGNEEMGSRLREAAQTLLDTDRPARRKPRRPFHWPVEFPEVFQHENPGFDAIVGNPPFMGGKRISANLGQDYQGFLKENLTSVKGSADLAAYFFLKAYCLLKEQGIFGLLATNTIAQGDTREVALDELVRNGCEIVNATSTLKWPGKSTVYVSLVNGRRGRWNGIRLLDSQPVGYISSFLDDQKSSLQPNQLCANEGISHMGTNVFGSGFRITEEEALEIIKVDRKYREVLFPFLNGVDINEHIDHKPSNWVINFHNWSLEKAEEYPICLDIVIEKVLPLRAKSKRKPYRENWWLFAERQENLYKAIANLDRCLVIALTSDTLAFAFIDTVMIFSNATIVVAWDDFAHFAILQSEFHISWARRFGSTMKGDARYTPTDCFRTFPFPEINSAMIQVGSSFYNERKNTMELKGNGLTAIYHKVHDEQEYSEDIVRLRAKQIEMDEAVAHAYGWDDLDLGHGFIKTKQGTRFSIKPTARTEILDRLLELNHIRYREEIAQGLHS